ncbi:flagellar biosynthesis anti-sigma factor FlgM [Hydrogenophaga sp.]|uniref:flagellar biosynthesis anti-sigma factor FlgM n=1 Tax=Hydrogenophaga sp. TaxID=1904254 RepID=UPI0019AA841C|nr:flagellar biosynthesis anti-sigma factor FlgM [Hydrogenophaga sp.]MBD3892595.1 flagellar biosynthesis anti-sigma factor FlgM [Hydrogenophaga sp.]
MKVESTPDSYIGSVAGGPHKAATAAPAVAAAVGAGAAAPAGSAKPQAGVTLTLSPASQALSAGAGGEVFNAGKVQAMQVAIANGSFQVNPQAIADKMLANAAEMLSAARQ